MRKKVVVLVVRQHSGEIDWILPLLHKLNGKFRIITIFSNHDAFLSLKRNNDLFILWKQICKDYLIINKFQNMFWKILHKVLFYFLKKNKFFYNNIEQKILLKTFSLKDFLSKFSLSIFDIKIIFLTHIHSSFLPNIFKKINKNISIIRFPESTMFFAGKKENKFYKDYRGFSRIYGDYFFFSSKQNAQMLLDSKLEKIKYCSQLRYEKWWNKKFSFKKKRNKELFKILVLLRGPNQLYFSENSYKKILSDLINLLKINKKFQLVFKDHPNRTIDHDEILKSFSSKKQIKISNSHVLKLSKECDMCISILTSACFDAVANKLPVIEYFDINKEIESSPNSKGFLHLSYNENSKKWQTIFEKKNIIQNIKTFSQLKNLVNDIYKKKPYIKNIFNKNYKNFIKLSTKGADSDKLLRFIEKI